MFPVKIITMSIPMIAASNNTSNGILPFPHESFPLIHTHNLVFDQNILRTTAGSCYQFMVEKKKKNHFCQNGSFVVTEITSLKIFS